jgi:hypothetical protein
MNHMRRRSLSLLAVALFSFSAGAGGVPGADIAAKSAAHGHTE